jgi:hypothetical protein
MSLGVAVFTPLGILRITGRITEHQVKAMNAGIRHLFNAGVVKLLIDALDASFEGEPAFQAALAIRAALVALTAAHPQRDFRIVGRDSRLAHCDDLRSALRDLEAAQPGKILEWIELQKEVVELKAEQSALLEELGSRLEEAKQARQENARMARLQEGLGRMLDRWKKRVTAWSALQSEDSDRSRLAEAKKRLRERKA